jgi:hypothetical protein
MRAVILSDGLAHEKNAQNAFLSVLGAVESTLLRLTSGTVVRIYSGRKYRHLLYELCALRHIRLVETRKSGTLLGYHGK